MAWQSTLPDDPVVACWWATPRPEPPPVDRPEWRVPALAARVRRTLRDIDAALIAACDCGYSNGCTWCQPGVDRRHAGPVAGHGIEAQWAGEVEHRGGG
jgi:hypothetical protein